MRYAEVCAGVHASGLAWPGWECAWVSEIEPFPCAVLAERYPGVPNLGDMLKITDEELAKHGPIDLLMGGTPCQSFSIAGLRKGLADPRGNLALAFLALAHRTHARWIVWENVPGVLSATPHDAPDPRPPGGGVASDPRPDLEDADDGRLGPAVVVADEYDSDEVHAFACFLAGLRELGYGFAYASLDAQFFGLAQRRERVFLVAHLGDWHAPAAVLLERACLRGDPPPSREARQDVAGSLASRSSAGGGLGTDMECSGGVVLGRPEDDGIAKCLTAPRTGSGGAYRGDADTETLIATDTAHSLLSKSSSSHDHTMETYVAHTLRGAGHDASEDGSGRGVPLVAATLRKSHGNPQLDATMIVAGPLCANGKAAGSATQQDAEGGMLVPTYVPSTADPICANEQRTTDNAGNNAGKPHNLVAFQCQGSNVGEMGSLRRGNGNSSGGVPFVTYPIQDTTNAEKAQHGLGIGEEAAPSFTLQAESVVGVAVTPFDTTRITSKLNRSEPRDGDPCHPLAAQAHPPAIAFTQKDHGADAGEELSPTLRAMEHDGSHANGGGQVAVVAVNMRGRDGGAMPEVSDVASVRAASGGSSRSFVAPESAMVRRLTPLECCRLQGFPDHYLDVTYRGKPAADGPKYRAIGNSIAVPCLSWIGARIEIVDAAIKRPPPPAAS